MCLFPVLSPQSSLPLRIGRDSPEQEGGLDVTRLKEVAFPYSRPSQPPLDWSRALLRLQAPQGHFGMWRAGAVGRSRSLVTGLGATGGAMAHGDLQCPGPAAFGLTLQVSEVGSRWGSTADGEATSNSSHVWPSLELGRRWWELLGKRARRWQEW